MSEVSARYRISLREMVYHGLATQPEAQAAAIADHYASHAALAVQLRGLVRARRECCGDDARNLDGAIAYVVRQITNAHAHDFGLELAWPLPPS